MPPHRWLFTTERPPESVAADYDEVKVIEGLGVPGEKLWATPDARALVEYLLSLTREGLEIDLEAGSLDDDFAELARNYGANHMLVTTLEQNAGILRLSYSLYQPDGGVERGTMVGAEPTELMRGMIRSIGASLGTQARPVGEITVISEDPFINAAYSRGLSFSLEGRCA